MHWATFKEAGSTDHSIGVVVGDQAHVSKSGLQLIDLLGDDGEALASEGDRTLADPSKIVAVSDVTILAPIPRPPSVRDFFAFEQHVKTSKERLGFEMDPGWYKIPVFYFTNPAAIIGPDTPRLHRPRFRVGDSRGRRQGRLRYFSGRSRIPHCRLHDHERLERA